MQDRNDLKTRLEDELFADASLNAYAVLDGARHLPTYNHLVENGAQHACLFGGGLDPEVTVTAPHLVLLREDESLFDWVFEGWGDSRGLFLLSRDPLLAVQKHLRGLIYAELPDGDYAIFRFFDPRVMRSFMPIATEQQQRELFGTALASILCESEAADEIVIYRK